MSFLRYYASFCHRNIKIFFLHWVGNGDVRSGRRAFTMVMLNSNVARLGIGALNLVLLLNHNGTETSSSCCVAKDVANAVVTKQKRSSVVATKRMITIDIHLAITNDITTCNSSTWERLPLNRGMPKRNLTAVRNQSEPSAKPRPGIGGARSQSLA